MWICLQDPGAKFGRPTDFPGALLEISNKGRSLIILKPVEPNSREKELASLQGNWLFDLVQTDAWPKPIGKGPDVTGQGSERMWSIKGDKIIWTSPEGKNIWLSFTLDPTKSPKHFDVTFLTGPNKGKKCLGLYDRGGMYGKSLWLCLTDPGSNAERPTDLSFATRQGRSLIGLDPVKPLLPQSPSDTNPNDEPAPVPTVKPVPKELEPFQGNWAIELCDSVTKTLGAPQFEAEKWRWAINGDEILWSREGEEWKLTLNVDPNKSPKEIDLTYLSGPFKGKKCLGVYDWEGAGRKGLRISIQDPGAKGDRPKQLDLKSTGQTASILLRPTESIDPEKELASLQGTWTFVNVMTKVWPIPIGMKNNQVNERRWVVKGDEISWIGRDGNEVKMSFTIDPQKVPRHIDVTFLSGPSKGQKCLGVYERLGGKHLDICLADPGSTATRSKQIFYSGQATYSWITLERDSDWPLTQHKAVIETVEDTFLRFGNGFAVSTDKDTKYTRLTDKGEILAERTDLKEGVRVRYEVISGKNTAKKVVILPTRQDAEQK